MKNIISVMIADDNELYSSMLCDNLLQEADIRVVGIAKDGIEALEIIKKENPDIIILDLIMPNLDGIGVLEKIAASPCKCKSQFVVLSAIGQDAFIKKAISLGAEYYFVKPFDIAVLILRIRQIYHEKQASLLNKYNLSSNAEGEGGCVETAITKVLHDVGIPSHLSGFYYIREAVILSINDTKFNYSISKCLYPEIAEKFNSTSQKVEQSIRNAILCSWERNKTQFAKALFGNAESTRGKPANAEFIALIVEKVKAENKIK